MRDKADTALDHIADALIEAHEHSRHDGDLMLRRLIEIALLHVGQRLAEHCVNRADPDFATQQPGSLLHPLDLGPTQGAGRS